MLFFVSSTFLDLRFEREAAQQALREMTVAPWGMEFYVSEPSMPLDVCLRELAKCGAVLLIVGHKAGSLIPGAPGLTYTRAEIEEALKLGRPVFVFIKTEGGRTVNQETDPDKHKALDEFMVMVSAFTPRYFETLDQMKYAVVTAITHWSENGRPGARQTFLECPPGEPRPGVKPLFDFQQALQGRTEELAGLRDFLADSGKVVAILPGRGGVGKTKLARDFAAQSTGWKQLWINSAGVWHGETEKEIPSGNVLIIADDGHRYDELQKLVSLVDELAKSRTVKLLIGTRPSGLSYVNGVIARVCDDGQVVRLKELGKLKAKETRALAEEVLGPDHLALAPALAELSKDTPLVTVVGGRLLARGSLLPAELGNEEGFQRSVLDKFTEECEGLLPSGGRPRRELLQLIAAVQPISPAYFNPFAEAASKFIGGLRPDQVLQGMNALEQAGILIRTRGGVRIAPDVLGDYLLETACVNPMGEATGFAGAVFGAFRELFLGNMVKNIAELDWRISRKHSDSDLLDEIWRQLTSEFRCANAADRRAVLHAIGSIVAFQPLPVLELVRQAMDTEAQTAKVYSFLVEQADVLKEVPELLGWIAFAPEATTEAVKRLWRLAKNGGRVGEEAQGVLKRLVAFRRNQNVEFNEKMMGLVEELATEPDAFTGSFTPLDLVDEVLDREVDFTEMSGRAVTFGALPLNYPVVRGVRERALGLLEKVLGSANPRAAIRAARSLGRILSGFLPKMGRALSESEMTWQNGERLRVVEMIRARVARGDAPIPLVRMLRATLRGLVRRHIDRPVLKAITAVFDEISESEALLVLDAICTGPWERDVEFDNLAGATKLVEDRRRLGVETFRKLQPLVAEQIAELNRIVEEALECGIEPKGIGEFVRELCRSDRQFLYQFREYLSSNEDSILAPLVMQVLLEFREVDRHSYAAFGKEMAGHKRVLVAESVARAVCYGPNLSSPIVEDVLILIELARRSEPAVLVPTFFGLARLGQIQGVAPIVCELAARVPLNEDPKLAEEFCEMFGGRGLDPAELQPTQVEAILTKLVSVSELSEHGVQPFLDRLSGLHPKLVTDFLIKRIERQRELYAADENTDYEPFPFRRMHLNGLRTTPEYEAVLRQLRDLVLKYSDELWTVPLFWSVATIDRPTLSVLDEWVHTAEPEKLNGILKLLTEAPPIVSAKPLFAIHLVEEFAHAGQEWEDRIIGRLVSNSLSFGFGYGIPSPVGNAHDTAAALIDRYKEDSPSHRLFKELVANKDAWSERAPMIEDAMSEEFE